MGSCSFTMPNTTSGGHGIPMCYKQMDLPSRTIPINAISCRAVIIIIARVAAITDRHGDGALGGE